MTEHRDWLSIEELANVLGLSYTAMNALVENDRLPGAVYYAPLSRPCTRDERLEQGWVAPRRRRWTR